MAAKISAEYRESAVEGMSLHITDDSMFVLIPSERGNNAYRLWMDEQTMQPKSCNCAGHKRWGTACKHMLVVADAFAGYKPIVPAPDVEEDATPVAEEAPAAEPRITEIETDTWYQINSNTAVYKVDGSEWIVSGSYPNAIQVIEAYLDKQSAVAAAEQIVAQSQDKPSTQEVVSLPKRRDVLDAPLTSSRGFQLLKAG